MTNHRLRAAAALVVVAGLFAAACGDDKGGSSASTTTGSGGSGSSASSTSAAAKDPLKDLGIDVKKDCPSDYKPTQGVSDAEILIGQSVPKTGPAASFQLLTTGMKAYFDYANTELGGVNGKKLKLVDLDDAYDPDKTVKNVNDLLNQGVFAFSGILGTPNNVAVRETLNSKCVPQLFPSTGSPEWGRVEEFPWTVYGAVVPYNVEARIWADYLKKTFPNGANIAVLQINNDFGKDYATWLNKYIAGTNLKIVKTEQHDPTNPDVTNQMTSLASTKADVAIAMTTGNACTSFMKNVGASGWKPAQIISGTCKSSVYFAPAGDGATNALVVAAGKEITYPEYDGNADIVKARELLTKYAPGAPIAVSLVPTGWLYGEILRDVLVRASKLDGGLTRPNVVVAARQTNLTSPLLYDGVKLKLDGTKDPYLIEAGRVEKWNGKAFEKVTDLYNYEGETKAKP